eukprot:1158472-Pelagomonas_calceolata.AAC.11
MVRSYSLLCLNNIAICAHTALGLQQWHGELLFPALPEQRCKSVLMLFSVYSNGVVRVGGRRVATSTANFTKGDVVGVVLDADQGEIVFFRNGACVEQGRARGIRGRLYPFISCDSETDQVTLLGSYSLLLDRIPRQVCVGAGAFQCWIEFLLLGNCKPGTDLSLRWRVQAGTIQTRRDSGAQGMVAGQARNGPVLVVEGPGRHHPGVS